MTSSRATTRLGSDGAVVGIVAGKPWQKARPHAATDLAFDGFFRLGYSYAAMPKSRFFFTLASELWIIILYIYTRSISIISPFIDEFSSHEPAFIDDFPQWIMEKISQRWIDPENLFFLHPLVIEHRHSYFKMIKMIHLLSMLNKDEHDDLRKDLLYIYNYV